MQSLEMYSPLSERSFVARMLQNQCGKTYKVCSTLQHRKCMRAKKCLADKANPQGIRICKKFVVGVARKGGDDENLE